MKFNSRVLGLTLALGLLASASSHAMVGVSLVGAGTFSAPDVKDTNGITVPYKSKLGLGGGGLVDIWFAHRTSLEVGVLYLKAKQEATISGFDTTTEFTVIQVPILVRFHLMRYLSIGVGGYVAREQGDVAYTATSGGTTTSGTSAYTNTKTDYGAEASLGLKIPMGMMSSILIDGRYIYGMKDLDPSINGKVNTRAFQLLAGLHFGF